MRRTLPAGLLRADNGDAMLAKALHIVASLGDTRLTACVSEAVMRTAEGEMAEFAHLRAVVTVLPGVTAPGVPKPPERQPKAAPQPPENGAQSVEKSDKT